jgi:ankyrin repeat protein
MTLHWHASRGDCEGLQQLLSQKMDVNERDGRNYTALACAISSPTVAKDVLRLLIGAGADVNAYVDDPPQHVLGLAARTGDPETVQILLQAGSDIRYVSAAGYSVLVDVMYSQAGQGMLLSIVDFLIEQGADLDQTTVHNETPMRVASFRGRFDVVKRLLDAGADAAPLGWDDLMKAIALGNADDVKAILERSTDLTTRDCYDRTPWLLCVQTGDLNKSQLLRAAGATIDECGRTGQSALTYAVAQEDERMLAWLLSLDQDKWFVDNLADAALITAAEYGTTACARVLLDAGANPKFRNEFNDTAITVAANTDIVRMLIGSGEDLCDASVEVKRRLTGLDTTAELESNEADYRAGRLPRAGTANPELMEVPFWHAMVRAGCSAWTARDTFQDTNNLQNGPVWCFDRFGMSFTEMPDGTFVQIGGEHEDYYDPDFHIYNDVIIHRSQGDFQILGYPEDVFRPTDFHSATYVDGSIYIIGGLGYSGSREFGRTPVYRLNCDTWQIEAIAVSGDLPGWIHEHHARLHEPHSLVLSGGKRCVQHLGQEKIVENTDAYLLDLSNMRWQLIRP